MASEKTLHLLVEEELKIKSPGIRECDDKTGKTPLGAADCHGSETSPVHLSLFAWKKAQTKKGFFGNRSDAGHESSQLNDASRVAAIANHPVDAGCAQSRVLLQNLSDEIRVWFHHALAQRFGVIELVGSNRTTDRVRMKNEFTCNGPDFPVFGIEQATDTGVCFRVDHENHLR